MSTRTRFLTVFRVFITIAILLTSLPLSSSNVTVQAAEPVTEEPERTPPGMRLYAIVDPAVVAPGGEATCTVTVANEDVEDETALTLHARISRDLSPAKGGGRTWKAEVPPLKVGERAEVALDLRVTGRPEEAMTFEIELRDAKGKVRATTTAVVGVARTDKAQRVRAAGGSFAAEDGRVRVAFRSGALPAEASVTAKMKTQQVVPWGRVKESSTASDEGVLLQFTLEAQDTMTGEEIHRFDQPVTLSIDMRGLIDETGLPAGRHLYLAYLADPETGRMNTVETIYDEETGLLTAEVDHFSEWEIGTVGEGWKPILTPPVPDLFSGAAVYNYPVQVPPGRHGLQPSVALSYNSRRIDTLIDGFGGETDGGPIALGWSLGGSEVEISRRNAIKSDGANDRMGLYDDFSLVLNGTSHDLEKEGSGPCGRYLVDGAPGVYVERFNAGCGNGSPDNWTTDYWIVRVEGTTYRLGFKENSEVYAKQGSNLLLCYDSYCSPDPNTYGAIRWRVDEVTDPTGNQMAFTYREKEIEIEVDGPNVFVQRSMVTEIKYNDYDTDQWASKVVFVPVSNTADDEGYMRIKRIDTYHLEERVQQVKLTTDLALWLLCGQTHAERALVRIQVFSGDGSVALPPVEFGHVALANYKDGCFPYRRVSEVNLGYGGRVAFSYESDGRRYGGCWPDAGCLPVIGYSYRVIETLTYDGMGDTPSRVAYDYGTRCYDQTNDNPASDGTNGGTLCSGSDPQYRGPLVGHDWVTVTAFDFAGSPVVTTTHRYHINDPDIVPAVPRWMRGREWQTEVYDGDGTLLQQSNTTWAGDKEFNYVSQVVSTDYTGAEPLSAKTTYSYTLAAQGGTQYGNLTHVREYGDGDTPYRTTVTTYTVNSDEDVWIVGKPREVKVYEGDVGGTLLGHTQNYYDYHTSLTTPPVTGTLTLVKQINPLSATHVITAEYKYDDWGNLTDMWGPLGNHTGIAYENTYHMYPITATNALDQHRYVQYYGINAPGAPAGEGLPGQVWKVWDDNGLDAATKYTYDVFGRLAEVIAPYDSASYPTVAYWYDETTADTRVVYEFYSNKWGDTLYNSLDNWQTIDDSYSYQQTVFRLSPTPETGTVALHRLFYDNTDGDLGRRTDTVYVLPAEVAGFQGNVWKEDQGILGYIWTSPAEGREPLYRCQYIAHQKYDYALAVGSGNCPAGYTQQGPLGYVEPAEAPIRVGVSQREVSGQAGTLDSYVYYDGWGRQVQGRGEAEGRQWTAASVEYDALGRAVRGYLPQFEDGFAYSAPDGIYTLTTYDALGRAVRVDNPDGTYATTVYSGLVTTAIDANGHQRRYTSDVWGQLIRVEEFTGTVSSGVDLYAATEYGYDTLGRLVVVTDTNGVTTTIHYDGLGRKDWMDDPDMGVWHYGYDIAGNLTSQTDARGCIISFDYDELNRLTGKTYSGACSGTPGVTYTYDETGHGYSVGRLTSMIDGSGSTAWFYDARGRVTQEVKIIEGAGAFVTGYTYDAANRVVTIMYPDGELVHQSYDDGGALESLSSNIVGQDPYVQNVDYNSLGQITTMAYGNDVATQYAYNSLNFRLEHVQASKDTTALLDLSYTYDTVGNVTSISDGVLGGVQYFTYDSLDRLTHAQAISGSVPYDRSYAYDEVGNITHKDGMGDYGYGKPVGIASGAKPHAVTHIDSDQRYWYDANGNMTTRVVISGTERITYTQEFNAENKLAVVTNTVTGDVTRFVYDGNGLRVKKIAPNGTTVYVGGIYEVDLGQTAGELFSDDFESGTLLNWWVISGAWQMDSGAYVGDADGTGLAVWHRVLEDGILQATLDGPGGYLVFDYTGPEDYRYGGVRQEGSNWVWELGQVSGGSQTVLASTTLSAGSGPVALAVRQNGGEVSLLEGAVVRVTYDYSTAGDGAVGLRVVDGMRRFENLEIDDAGTWYGFADGFEGWTPASGEWLLEGGDLSGQQETTYGIVLAPEGLTRGRIEVAATTQEWTDHSYNAIIVFDYQDGDNFRYARMSEGVNQWLIGEFIGGTYYDRAVLEEDIQTGVPYQMAAVLEDGRATLVVDGEAKVSYDFGAPFGSATVGLAVHHAHTHYDDVRLIGLQNTPSSTLTPGLPEGWETVSGSWEMEEGVLSGEDPENVVALALSPVRMQNGQIVARMASLTWSDHSYNGAIVFNYQNADNFYYAQMRAGADQWALGKRVGGENTLLATLDEAIAEDTFYDVEVLLRDGEARLLVNGEYKLSYDYGAPFAYDRIGFFTGYARMHVDELRVTEMALQPLKSFNFSSGASGWTPVNGTWQVESGEYSGQLAGAGSVSLMNGATLSEGWMKATIRTKSWSGHSHNGFLVLDYGDLDNLVYAGMLDGSNKWRITRRAGGSETMLGEYAEDIATNVPYEVEIIVRDGQVALVVDGQHRVKADLGSPASGPVGLRVGDAHSHFDNVVLAPMTPLTTTVETFVGDLDGWTPEGGDWLVNGTAVSGQQEDTEPGDVWGLLLSPDGLTDGRMDAVVTTQSWTDHSYNGGFVFDYQDAANFRWARMLEGVNRWVIGETVAGLNTELATLDEDILTGVPYHMTLVLEGGRATLLVDGVAKVSYDFGAPFSSATVGLGMQHAHTHFEDVTLTPWEAETTHRDDAFDCWEPGGWEKLSGEWWSDGEMHGVPGASPALAARIVPWSGEGIITGTVIAETGSAARVVFGLQDVLNYRYAEVAAGTGWRIGQVVDGVDTVLAQGPGAPVAGQPYEVRLEMTGGVASLYAGGALKASHDFGQAADGRIGLGVTGSEARFDDVSAQAMAPAAARSYYYAAGQRVAMRITVGVSTTVAYLHGDHLGSTSLTTDAGGQVVARVLYYPYGEVRYTEGTLPTDFGFTGQRVEESLGGLMDYNARYYDPALGRFVSADTIVPDPAKPQSFNRFAYVYNNPLKYTDPSGHRACMEDDRGNLVCYNSPGDEIKVVKAGTAPPKYDPFYWSSTYWGDGLGYEYNVQLSNNCYSYAANDPFGHAYDYPRGDKPQPGERSGQPYDGGATTQLERYKATTVENIRRAAIADGFVPVEPDEPCPVGTYKVMLFIDPYEGEGDIADYHWYRQDRGGGWSHKPGHRAPTNVDASGDVITDPRTADRDYTSWGGANYSEFGGCFCVPNEGIRTGYPQIMGPLLRFSIENLEATLVVKP